MASPIPPEGIKAHPTFASPLCVCFAHRAGLAYDANEAARLCGRLRSYMGYSIGVPGLGLGSTWTPKVCRMMAFWAMFCGFGLFFYLLLGLR